MRASSPNKIAITQYDLNNNLIARYDSIKDACRATGYKIASLSAAINNKAKTSHAPRPMPELAVSS